MIHRISSLLSSWKAHYRALDSNGRACVWWVTGCCVITLVLIFGLREMVHPWEGKTGDRISNGEPLRPEDYGRIGIYWTGVANAVLWLLLGLSACKWWAWTGSSREMLSVEPGESKFHATGRWRGGRAMWLNRLGLIVILLVAVSIRYPQLQRSVMFDEQDNLRWNIHGYYNMDHTSGKPKFQDSGWEGAFFANRKGNNPILLSVTSRASIAVWRKMTGAPAEVFSRTAMRIPVFLAGILSIVGIYWLLIVLNMRRAALLAALLAAVHPFHIEYSIEARGYGFVILGASMAMPVALLALRTNKWRYWSGLGLCFFVMLYAYLGSVYFVATLGVMIAAYLGYQLFRLHKRQAGAALARLLVVGVVTLSVYLQLAMPALMQFKDAWVDQGLTNPLNMEWLFAVITEYSTGALLVSHWREAAEASGGDMSLVKYVSTELFRTDPWYVILITILIPLCLLAGVLRLWRTGSEVKLLAAAVIIAPVMMFLHHRFGTHSVLLFWYMIYSLPAVIVFIGAGLDAVGCEMIKKIKPVPDAGRIAISLVIVVSFFWLYIAESWPGKKGRNTQRREDHRAYVSFKRGSYHWVVYKNGYSIRVRDGKPIPETFDPKGWGKG